MIVHVYDLQYFIFQQINCNCSTIFSQFWLDWLFLLKKVDGTYIVLLNINIASFMMACPWLVALLQFEDMHMV